ncbi:hypothetical protein VE01_03807 [Pseudogymnoascus verrucosus]|uniref:BHLH domain-containing protein n=1 Tax=Pseudogymnoascus verrucosus TaxID=342668 RepID=A0A1B8GQS1_9PEZI|nr:uncharacterized protein VE01_03807 [Pseudogymnoascus verrucosus]OBT98183.1 hypothetical protein VE01_03807 [Pseudogymnoascus verrucosus]
MAGMMPDQPFPEYQAGPEISPSLDGMLNLDVEPMFPEFWDIQDTPPFSQEGLDQAPLPWSGPPMGMGVGAPMQPNVESLQQPAMGTLSVAQQELLRSIAMPAHLQYPSARESRSPHSRSPHSATSRRQSGSVTMSSPDHQSRTRKRKSSTDGNEEDHSGDETGQRPVKKTAHNMIEKRYRTNLNDKILALRDSVPSLRVMTKSARGSDGSTEVEDLEGLIPAHKLNKATVLSKATEYIRHLEKRSKRLAEENESMKARVAAFEKLFLSGSMGFNMTPNPTPPPNNQFNFEQQMGFTGGHGPMGGQMPNTQMHSGQMSNRQLPNGQLAPNGNHGVVVGPPQDFRRAHRPPPINQQAYQIHQEPQPLPNRAQGGTNAWGGNGAYFGKIMVGSLAGLMVLDNFSESHSSGGPSEQRGLFALPTQLLTNAAKFLKSSGEINILGHHSSSAQTLSYLRFLLLLGALLSVFLPSFFRRAPPPSSPKSTANATLASLAPTIASPLRLRRRAFLTALQTIWIPAPTPLLSLAALTLKLTKLTLLTLVGAPAYALLTGSSSPSETARIKAWSIALDAQLIGGDPLVSRARLTLTLLASATLPATPARLMLQALHIRILFHNAPFPLSPTLAAHLARKKWSAARALQLITEALPASGTDVSTEPLPPHLLALLAQPAKAVFSDAAIKTAHALTYNTPPLPAEDRAIRSPLDVLAAAFSTSTLHTALESSLLPSSSSSPTLSKLLSTALATAPPGSTPHLRVLTALALFASSSAEREENLGLALAEAAARDPPPETGPLAPKGLLLRTTMSAVEGDVHLALACASTLQRLAYPVTRLRALVDIEGLARPNSVLGFAACYAVLRTLQVKGGEDGAIAGKAMETLAGNLRVGIGGPEGEEVEKSVREGVVGVCVSVVRACVVVGGGGEEEVDAGYGSMSDE